MMNELAGDELVSEFNKGNKSSFSSIFNTFYSSLCFFAEKMVLDKQEAEDIVEETFVKLWRLHANFQTMQNVKAFLYITTKNACLNYIKQSERTNRQQAEMLYLLAQKEDHVLSAITKAEVLREVHAAIESLPPQCRKVVQLSFLEGLKNQEIADRLKLSINTVKNQKMRAIALLKIKLLSTNLMVFMVLYSHLADKN